MLTTPFEAVMDDCMVVAFVFQLKFEDVDTHDNFSYVLNSRVEVDEMRDGWKEFPVIWPAVYVLPGMV